MGSIRGALLPAFISWSPAKAFRGRYGSMFRHDRGQPVAMPFGSIRPARRFPALICLSENYGEEDCNRSLYVRPRQARSGASELTWPASALFEPTICLAISCMPGIPAVGRPSSKTSRPPPLEVLFPKDGVLSMAAAPGRVTRGDPACSGDVGLRRQACRRLDMAA